MAAGLLKFHPPTGFDFDRRQLAVVYNMPYGQGGGLRAQALEVSDDLERITILGGAVTLPQQSCNTGLCPSAQRFSVTAGGFIGAGSTFWSEGYGSLPDPALKLPHRFSPIAVFMGRTIWEPNESANAKKIRGFFVRFAEPSEDGTFWYHDHNLGVTRIAVMSGLVGFYLIRELNEKRLRLPRGEFEIPLVIQDKTFNEDGSIWEWFPWQPEFFGDYAVVNGKVWPKLEVKRGKYRFRMLNGANARFFDLTLDPPPPPGAFMQIGTDGGFLPKPVDLTDPDSTPFDGLLMAPAERADVIIDFSAYDPGTEVIMKNNAPDPFPGGGEEPLDMVMKLIVGETGGRHYSIPRRLTHLPVPKPPIKERFLTLVDFGSPTSNYPPPPPNYPYPTLLLNNRRFSDPPTETPAAGSTEIWNFINLAPDTHPIHLHQTQFRILSRRDFDVDEYIAEYGVDGPVEDPDIPFTDDPMPPYPFEDGLKDTVRANPGQVTRIEIPFGPYRGRFVWHCHILDHEDNEMMLTMMIV